MANDNILGFPKAARGSPPVGRRLIPGKLRDARLAARLNQSELAAAIGVSRQAISAFEQGDKGPEHETMMQITNALGQPLSYFVAEEMETFGASSVRFFRAFGPDTKRRNLACEVIGKWFTQTVRYFDRIVNLPTVDLIAVAPSAEDGRYSEDEIERAAEECRSAWGLGLGPISNVVSLLEGKGIAVSRFEISGEKAEAFSFWSGSRPFIILSSDKESCVRSRFDAAHELGHLILHRWVGPEELEDPKVLKAIEREANRFASAFLLPRRSFPNEVYTPRLDAFVDLKRRWKVAIQAMVYRCKDLGIFDEFQVTNLYKQISFRKWRTKEPLDDPSVLPLEQPKLMAQVTKLVLQSGRKAVDELCVDLSLNPSLIETLCSLPAGTLKSAIPLDFVPSLK